MDCLPTDLVLRITEILNPAERWRLSATSRRYRELLPVWLRIRILSRSSHSSLKADFYVSRAAPAGETALAGDSYAGVTTHVKPLEQGESLDFGVEYLFWTFDYQRENPVFLGRHGQKLLYNEDPHFLYTLGLRPKEPNQTWIVSQGKLSGPLSENSSVEHNGGHRIKEGDRPEIEANIESTDPNFTIEPSVSGSDQKVPFQKNIGLTVGGRHPKPYRPDSSTRLYLSSHTLSIGALWYVIQGKEWTSDEELQIVPSFEYNEQKRLETSASSELADDNYITSREINERDLIIHAVPDILDGGYSLYSPDSLQKGEAACELYHAAVPFTFWIEGGIMKFQAFSSLKFTFGVPILEEDNVEHTGKATAPLEVLLKKNSSRWWAIKHYMSTAADVAEGREFQMDSFMRSSKDHEDHTILHDERRNLVYIEVQDAVVDRRFPSMPKDQTAIWKFLLCG